MEVLWIFSLWDKEIDTWFTNHETLIPTLIAIWCNHSWSMNFLKSTWKWDFFFFKFHSDYKVYNVSSNRKISGLLEHLIFFFRDGVCPIFKSHDITYYPDRFADREIQELIVVCINKKNGCRWSGCLRDLKVCFFIFRLFFSFDFIFIMIGCMRSMIKLETLSKTTLSNTKYER